MTGVFGVVLGQILLMFLYLIIGYVLYRTGLITCVCGSSLTSRPR